MFFSLNTRIISLFLTVISLSLIRCATVSSVADDVEVMSEAIELLPAQDRLGAIKAFVDLKTVSVKSEIQRSKESSRSSSILSVPIWQFITFIGVLIGGWLIWKYL